MLASLTSAVLASRGLRDGLARHLLVSQALQNLQDLAPGREHAATPPLVLLEGLPEFLHGRRESRLAGRRVYEPPPACSQPRRARMGAPGDGTRVIVESIVNGLVGAGAEFSRGHGSGSGVGAGHCGLQE